jgi:hypothetical protein
MSLRVARGSELPPDWQPGEPLTVGRTANIRPALPTGCPFGPLCYSCRNGLQWDPEQSKHTADAGHRRVSPRPSRSKRQQPRH